MLSTTLSILTSALLASSGADTSEPPTGIEIGPRGGVALPIGKSGGGPIAEQYGAALPIWIDAGYRLRPWLFLGAYYVYAPTTVAAATKESCTLNAQTCSAHDVRIGVQAQFHPRPASTFDPWLGIGAGYESLTLSWDSAAARAKATSAGIEIANLQLGSDFHLHRAFAIGPFASASFGLHSSFNVRGTFADGREHDDDYDLPTELHLWLSAGVRATLVL